MHAPKAVELGWYLHLLVSVRPSVEAYRIASFRFVQCVELREEGS